MSDQDAIDVSREPGHIGHVRLQRPPNNFFSLDMIAGIADALETMDDDDDCRVVVLSAQGKHFCAGADLTSSNSGYTAEDLYAAAVRLFRTRKPIVAAVQGAVIGGGVGLCLAADFRVAAPDARFSVNFAKLGFHHGFGLSVTLPALVGQQMAAQLLYTGRRIDAVEATRIGLVDALAPDDDVLHAATALASEIAAAAPLAVESIRATLRADLADRIAVATAHEAREQARLRATDDFVEGVTATAQRRPPRFTRR
ncbi:enoyl-CoA hydratase/isomerase family protein [Ilumatobacter coccineus]|uniref:Putative enoyl-CoA hydratase n=1 Tax=Ilumatobacter coccineus (strain NBRC 103263 / KCTC 29153 / YM16-304) TaxID=1313172 RepID=A0A6C7EEX6_ILUCY|nr:enoyl-CoA hydratase/isomerase family protein [Ilumatobacter coccineus]BAN03595.1 putative enoyl-CoA hydratase [Ilumatobacter coccineus YM16-304]